jgi:hypothetical protein
LTLPRCDIILVGELRKKNPTLVQSLRPGRKDMVPTMTASFYRRPCGRRRDHGML